MSIMSGQKTWLLLGVLAITGGAAFVYFDPLGLDLLGLKSGGSAAKSAAAPNGHTAAAKAAVAPAKPAISAASAVLPATGAAITPAAPSSAVVAISPATAEVPPPVLPALQHPPESSKTVMSAGKAPEPGKTAGRSMKPTEPMKPMDSDLRYCLKLDTDAAIAKCAGE